MNGRYEADGEKRERDGQKDSFGEIKICDKNYHLAFHFDAFSSAFYSKVIQKNAVYLLYSDVIRMG